MKLSISNIGWAAEQDLLVYQMMQRLGYTGLEIAPTRIFPEAPYDKLQEAADWSRLIKEKYGFSIPSMQSIWFGRQEKIFHSEEDRSILIDYTKKAIDFAAAVGSGNLVFGCPRNRNIAEGESQESAVDFFRELGDYAVQKGTVIGMEANPPIYNTNYINDTRSAIELIREVGSKGFLLNLDVGTMIQNKEEVSDLVGNVHLINHVHISEPGLKPIEVRKLHEDLCRVLRGEKYQGFVSIEMGKIEELEKMEEKLIYVKEVFS